jgi:hypothetical protein
MMKRPFDGDAAGPTNTLDSRHWKQLQGFFGDDNVDRDADRYVIRKRQAK